MSDTCCHLLSAAPAGLTNKYLCETHAAAAVTYGYASPNENTHAATTINLLLDTKVLDHLPVEEFEVIRSMITDVILPTDMVVSTPRKLWLWHSPAAATSTRQPAS